MSIDEGAAFTFKINALDQLMLENPDRKSTLLQKRNTLKGRKSVKSIGNESDNRGSAADGKANNNDRMAPNPDSVLL